ncbi:O-antigen ligase [Olivibacter sp. XZL3]|uniref:O-antigen ligase family protein n=1 Tax=Olivibacter sp. XZL3 TaxID=1735116 RepID=UPI001416EEDA|nr:O-antigen ligase family protein [Olivibacter sp. XZL3]
MQIVIPYSRRIIVVCILLALASAVMTVKIGLVLPLLVVVCCCGLIYSVFLLKNPAVGLYTTLAFCFLMPMLGRELDGMPFGIGVEVLLIGTWLAIIVKHRDYDWAVLKTDLMTLTAVWFIISVLELFNPAGASVMGWLQEIRNAALHAMLLIPLALLILSQKEARSINTVLWLFIGISVLAALNGYRQLKFLTPGEKLFLEEMASTHLIWGKLRVFSFYTDAGQFGASQAHILLITLILAVGPFKWWVKALCAFCAMCLLVGMLISGTRGAFFVLFSGLFFSLILFKNFKALVLGGLVMALLIGFLKYTTVGSGNYQIARLRTALDPEDASLNLRFINQRRLSEYLKSRPFGGGLGVIGIWGHEYNSDKYLSTIEPDSYWVKVWAMYGIVGFIIWFCMMMYLFGKCGGIIWRIENRGLKIKLVGLTAGAFGVFIASYGNEVINRVPSSLVVYMSFALVYLGPRFDRKLKEANHPSKVV